MSIFFNFFDYALKKVTNYIVKPLLVICYWKIGANYTKVQLQKTRMPLYHNFLWTIISKFIQFDKINAYMVDKWNKFWDCFMHCELCHIGPRKSLTLSFSRCIWCHKICEYAEDLTYELVIVIVVDFRSWATFFDTLRNSAKLKYCLGNKKLKILMIFLKKQHIKH